MRDYVIMADVNTDIDREYAREKGIAILPQYYHFNDGVIYGDEQVLTDEAFYGRLAKERAYSMGCNPERVRGIMEEALKQEKDILVIMGSSECSGSYNTVRLEAEELEEEYPGSRIYVLDSLLECSPAGLLVRMAVDDKEAGKSMQDCIDMLERRKSHCDVYFLVDHLDYLVRGGRLSPISGMVGNMLSIKPILHFENGKIVPLMKCRGKQAAKKAVLEQLKNKKLDRHYFAGAHTMAPEEGQAFCDMAKAELGIEALCLDSVSLIIGTHVGPGAVAYAFCTED